MGGKARGSSSGERAAGAAAAGPSSTRNPRTMYGSTAFGSELSLDHVVASKYGYCSLEGSAEAPPVASASARRGDWVVREMFGRVVAGAVVLALFVATISSLKDAPEAAARGARARSPTMAAKTQHGGVYANGDLRFLKIRASNEYGEFDQTALRMYGLSMVMEPHRETTLKVELDDSGSSELSNIYVWRLEHAEDSGITAESVAAVWSYTGGPEGNVTVDRPGTLYQLTVQNLDADGVVLAEGRVQVACKYVRREIRSLNDEDREAFFEAMEIFYTVPTAVGKSRYGKKFNNYERVVAYHDARISDYCYHDGLQFLTSHAAFNLVVERYLQMINPRVCLPLWDFMVEAATKGDEWYDSIIFDEHWFGSALGSPENDFMLSEGRFGNISTIYDPEKKIAKGGVKSNHNAYGYVTSTKNYQDLPRLTRTTSYCGLTSHATFATAETFIACFEEHSNLDTWEDCMETKVHGDLHGLLGGGFNCNTDMKAFSEEHPEYSVRLLSFVLEYMTFNYWPMNGFIPSANTCDTECTRGQTEPCGCTCNIDAFAISDQETYDYCESFMSNAATKFSGDEFITYDADARYPYGFLKNEERMSDGEALLLMRYMVKIGCEPGSVGAMSTGSSPLDPIFWVLHEMFEKALHILWLSPKYAQRYNMEWVDGSCSGSSFTDELPFTENLLGLGTGKTFLTNEEIMTLMHPTNVGLPYVYEDFNTWGTADDAGLIE